MTFYDVLVPLLALVGGAVAVVSARASARRLDRESAPERSRPAE